MREPERDLSRLEDILSAINNVEEYTKDLSEEQLKESKLYLTRYHLQCPNYWGGCLQAY